MERVDTQNTFAYFALELYLPSAEPACALSKIVAEMNYEDD